MSYQMQVYIIFFEILKFSGIFRVFGYSGTGTSFCTRTRSGMGTGTDTDTRGRVRVRPSIPVSGLC